MKKSSTLFVAALIAMGAFSASAQYVTKGDKSVYTFKSLSQIPESGVKAVNGAYQVSQDIEIAATDTLRLENGDDVRLANKVVVKILGYGDFAPKGKASFSRTADSAKPKGIYFYTETAAGDVKNVSFEYCGLKYGGSKDFSIDNCTFTHVTTALSGSGCISLGSTGCTVTVSNCRFENNEATAIGGAANFTTGLVFKNNYLYDCNTLNSNKPFINVTVGGDLPIIIEGNTIVGNKRTKVGGIGVGNMIQLKGSNTIVISNNKVMNCRYGITTIGPMDASITGNVLINNCYETNANNGGSGISIYDSSKKQNAMISGNYIDGNLWGVTVIGGNNINLGNVSVDKSDAAYNPGGNIFVNNGNNGVLYDLYNNTSNTVYAQNNTWNVDVQDEASIEKVVTHKKDISSLGEVIFMPAKERQSAPHSLTATANFQDVTLAWKSPTEKNILKWHDGKDYNGYSAAATDPEGACQFVGGAKFTAAELKNYAGCAIDSIAYFEYRNIYEAYAQIYENGKLVVNKKIDLSNYKKNSWRSTALNEPYYISGNDDVIIGIKYMHGTNQSFVGIVDRAATGGKGNLVSTDDGKTWAAAAPGDFLISAYIHNLPSAKPDGYYVYRNGEKAIDNIVTEENVTLKNEPEGDNVYSVAAVYGSEEKMSGSVEASSVSSSKVFPAVATISGSVKDGLNGTIEWHAPLTRSNKLTWGGETAGISIGGTSTTAPKVWIKQEFDGNDMLVYPNHQITAINAYIAEKEITGVTLFVMKNGVIDYSQVVSADDVATIEAKAWHKFALDKPYKFEQGNTYAFGCYYTHNKSAHPVGVDATQAVEAKGNSFSVSSPSSKFNSSKPTWKSLSAGNIAGNFMLSADIEALGEAGDAPVVDSYIVYRNGEVVAKDVKDTKYTETSNALGSNQYTVVAVGTNGYKSVGKNISLNYTLPESIVAPIVTSSQFTDDKKFSMTWSNDAIELKHYATPSYTAGFQEDMNMMYGARFKADELAKGYAINSIKFAIGASIPSFKIEVYSGTDKLVSEEINGNEITAGALYNLTLTSPVNIPEGKDLYIVYNASLPAKKTVLILDGGPAVENGAVVSLTNGANWLNLGTIAPDYAKYNIVIGATAIPSASAAPAAKSITLGNALFTENADNALTISAGEYGIEATGNKAVAAVKAASAKAESAKISVIGYRVYCNSKLVKEINDVNEKTYSEVIKNFGEYGYAVSNVYNNGWESALSKVVNIDNFISQKTQAPYGLKGKVSGKDLTLTWDAIDANAAVMKYHTGDTDLALGMTGGTTREGYQAIKFTADTLAEMKKVGEKISHIRFKLASNDITSLSAFVMYGDDIVFEQPVNVEDAVAGWNTVRLNKAVAIPEHTDVSVGYHITYKTGLKPLMMDAGPSVKPGYSDLISSSATAGYWYSLKTKFKQDYNWRIEGIFAKADQELNVDAAPAESTTTYNVYRDGTVIASGVADKAYTVKEALAGKYTVTAVDGDNESAESNAVFYGVGGVDGIASNGAAFYDRAADAVILPAAADAQVFTAGGAVIKSVSNVESVDMSDLESGIYIVKAATSIVKVVK